MQANSLRYAKNCTIRAPNVAQPPGLYYAANSLRYTKDYTIRAEKPFISARQPERVAVTPL